MEVTIDPKIYQELEKDFKKFKSILFDADEKFYEEYKKSEFGDDLFFNYYIMSIVSNKKFMKKKYDYLVRKGCDPKKINKLFYTHLKFEYKADNKLWSWNEINELDLNLSYDEKINFSNYKFF